MSLDAGNRSAILSADVTCFVTAPYQQEKAGHNNDKWRCAVPKSAGINIPGMLIALHRSFERPNDSSPISLTVRKPGLSSHDNIRM